MAEKIWGHKVLPLAPYSPELNPIEKVWAILNGICEPFCLITPDLTMHYCPILILINYTQVSPTLPKIRLPSGLAKTHQQIPISEIMTI